MRIKIYAALTGLLVIIGLTPWVDGIIFKYKYMHFIKAFNQDNRVQINLIEYKRGWMYSTAKININIPSTPSTSTPSSLPLDAPVNFVMTQDIKHGPIFYNNIRHRLETGYASIQNSFQIPPIHFLGNIKSLSPLQINLHAKFDGDWHGQLQIPTIFFSDPDIGNITWYGMDGDIKIIIPDDHIKLVIIKVQLGSIDMQGSENNALVKEFVIKPIKYKYIIKHEASGLWSGNSSMYTPGILLTRKDGINFTIDTFALNSAFSIGLNTFYNTNFSVFARNVRSTLPTFPAISIFKASFSASNFNTEGLNKYINYIQANASNAVDDVDVKSIESLLAHTITQATTFTSDLFIDSSLGKFTSSGRTKWKFDSVLLNTFEDVFNYSQTKANIRTSQEIMIELIKLYAVESPPNPAKKPTNTNQTETPADPAQQTFNDMILGGFINNDNNDYVTTLIIENGLWKFNGRAINSPPPAKPATTSSQ